MPMRTREEQRAYQLAWIKARRDEWIKENGPCEWCESYVNLEVDHVDSKTKLYNVSSLWSLSKNNPKRVIELAKCQVLCEDCHTKKTNEDQGNGEYIHGTMLMYHKKRCRCNECKECIKLYFREYRKRTNRSPIV